MAGPPHRRGGEAKRREEERTLGAANDSPKDTVGEGHVMQKVLEPQEECLLHLAGGSHRSLVCERQVEGSLWGAQTGR